MSFAPHPASSSSRLVTGDDHVTCCTRGPAWLFPRASGAVVALPPPVHDVQSRCSSQKTLNLWRGEACHVRRPLTFLHVPSSVACVSVGTYVHAFTSPAFALLNMPATSFRLPCERAAAKNHRRSFMTGPPNAPLTSQIFVIRFGARRPASLIAWV